MTKSKKHARPTLEEALAQPWCYYCEKTYTDVGALLSHQKDKHFQCPCRRRLNTAGGLKVHMAQVHKEELKEVPNALPHRKDPSIEVFTTVGIPEDVLKQHQQEVETEFYRQEYEHRLRTGNPAPGTAQPGAVKKQKIESSESLKARVAARRAEAAARKAAEASGSPMPSTNSPIQPPTPTTASPAPANGAHPFTFNTGPNVFSPHPVAIPGQAPPPGGGLPYPVQQVASPIPSASVFGPPPGMAPIAAAHGQFLPQNPNGHPIPLGPGTNLPHPPTNGSPHGAAGNPSAQINDHTPHAGEPSALPERISLPKLFNYALDAIRAVSIGKGDGNGASDGTGSPFKPVDLFVALCNGVYGSTSVSPSLLSKAEDILRGLLKLGVDNTLPVGFEHLGKVFALRESIATASVNATVPVEQAGDQKAKKKNAEVRKLRRDSMSWEEQVSLHRGAEKRPSIPTSTTGPAADAVTGVVGDGETGCTVMEE